MEILVLCDDEYHPGKVVKDGLEPLKVHGYDFAFNCDAKEFPVKQLDEYPLVILSKSNNTSSEDLKEWMDESIQKAFDSYVENGGALLVIHSGTAGYKDAIILRQLMGGVFSYHPEQCPVTMNMLPDQGLTTGCSEFTVMDEHYHVDIHTQDIDIFMTTQSVHGIQPGGWTRRNVKGRICVLTPGHNVEVWLHPSYQKLILNAINWCLGN